jgi:hypothetical protein
MDLMTIELLLAVFTIIFCAIFWIIGAIVTHFLKKYLS